MSNRMHCIELLIILFLILWIVLWTLQPNNIQDEPVDTPRGYTIREANVSAYCPCKLCCGKFADGMTANGHVIQHGDCFIAAPKDYAFGTMVAIPGYNNNKPVPVLDRGGAIKGNKIDLFFFTHQEALNFGRQYLTIKVYDQN